MPKYLCDYCDVHLNFDSQSARKQHNRGRKHQENVRGYYAQYAAALAATSRTAIAAANAGGATGGPFIPPTIRALPPASVTPTPLSYHPYAPSHHHAASHQPLSIRPLPPYGASAGGPPPSAPGYPPPSTSSYPPHSSAAGPPPPSSSASLSGHLPPPPFGSYPPPTTGGPGPAHYQSNPTMNAPPPPQSTSAGGATEAPKTFINPDRMRALGLQDHH